MAETKKEKEPKEITFEKAMTRLQQIVTLLEEGSQPLEKSIGLFEEGEKLTKICEEKLKNAQQKVTKLCAPEDENNE